MELHNRYAELMRPKEQDCLKPCLKTRNVIKVRATIAEDDLSDSLNVKTREQFKQKIIESLHRPENERYLRNFTSHDLPQRNLIHKIYTEQK